MSEPTAPLALVTGGASGIGAAVARGWVERGGRVAVLDLRADAIDVMVSELGTDRAVGVVVDVSSAEAVDRAVAAAAAALGGIDVVVNCAGIARPAPAATVADADWVRVVDIHLAGTMRVCRAAHPHLAAGGRGAIVNLSSVGAGAGMPGRSSYCAAKAGIEGLTRVLAVEWAPDGIRVNAVAPGYVQSHMTDALIRDGVLNAGPVIERTPLRRFAQPEEIAESVLFLASPAASYVTGQTLYVDGGMSVDGNWY